MTEDPEKYIEGVDELPISEELSILSQKLVEFINQLSLLSHAEKCMVILHSKQHLGDRLLELENMLDECTKESI